MQHILCQHCAMRIVCPECQSAYNVGSLIKNAILVCHRCDTEFDTFGNRIDDNNPTKQVFLDQENAAPTFGIHDLMQSGMNNRQQHIIIWMLLVLFTLSAIGLATRWSHWQYNGMIRGYVVQSDNTTPILDRDWFINPASVSTQWVTRDDQSIALLIEGEVENQLATILPPPEIQITFVTQTGQNIQMIQGITEPSDLKTLQHAPYASPAIDEVPVLSSGKRGFMLLIEDAPNSTQHILLHALAVQRQQLQKPLDL
ncbi:MAG: hypothetical protein Q9M19_08430 [Mariprofundaceae bacterium]|nr:hypothetical protein [Mariprofundaceae bacterium]